MSCTWGSLYFKFVSVAQESGSGRQFQNEPPRIRTPQF
uniref:Uncharacterized protein n=1 Tax=Vitis vinifera TaxID=29760 RepID=F6HV34_VITVI